MAELLEVNESNWETEVINSELPVVVDFWAPWCGPCRALAPTVEAVAGDLAGKARFVKVNTDEAPNLATRYSVMSIPVLMIFKGGRIVDQIAGGGHPRQRIIDKITPHL